MTIHYHGTPVNPKRLLNDLAGRHFCVSFYDPRQVHQAHQIGQSVMLDNGAFSAWKRDHKPNWNAYYAWCDEWLDCPTTWAVIPDVIDGGEEMQDALLSEWPHGDRGAPVWHVDESLERLYRLTDGWPRVCIGSAGRYAQVGSDLWYMRMTEVFNGLSRRHRRIPVLHMLRGMSMCGKMFPFASVDSTDIARNHNLAHQSPRKMAERWDGVQCALRWHQREEQPCMLETIAHPARGR